MLKTQSSLMGILLLAVFIETTLVPGIFSRLRIDLFMGMIIGVIIHLSFSQGLGFVVLASLLLQAFSGARPGLIPMIYLCSFIVTGLLKGVIYLENIFTQVFLSMALCILVTFSLAVSLDMNPTQTELAAMAAGALLTGCTAPFMVALVGHLKKTHEA